MRRYRRTVSTDQLLPGFDNFLDMGMYLTGDQEFTDEAHMKRVWIKNRERIMKEYAPGGSMHHPRSPGALPYGYWKFELKELPPSGYYEQTRRLLELGKLAQEDINAIKKDPLVANLVAGKNNDLRRLFGIDKVLYIDPKHRDKG